MKFQSPKITSLILVCTILNSNSTVLGQQTNLPVSTQCQEALDRTKNKLKQAKAWSWQETVNNQRVPSEFYMDKTHRSDNPWKASRDMIMGIVLGEPGLDNVENSPQFMKNIAQDIIDSCSNIVLVYFQLGYEWGEDFGLMPDRTIKQFECFNSDILWGYTGCL